MKITKYNGKGAVWYKHKELDKEGKMISLSNTGRIEPDYFKVIRREFSDLDPYRSEPEEVEDFIYYLNKEVDLEETSYDFDMPLPDSTKEYFIIFNDKIWLYIIISDEYMGGGDSSTYAHINSILVPEDTPIEEVKEVRGWLIKGGFKMLRGDN